MKKCPFCAEEIQSEAIKCRFCNELLTTAPAGLSKPLAEVTSPEKSKHLALLLILITLVVSGTVHAVWREKAIAEREKAMVEREKAMADREKAMVEQVEAMQSALGKARAQGQLTACKSNCKNLATALEMYASDNQGYYPVTGNLQVLMAGNYLRMIPTCPATGSDTYSGNYKSQSTPDSFSFQCTGDNHAKAYTGYSLPSTNYPQYDAEQGLLDHP